jgi:hypothetical protein
MAFAFLIIAAQFLFGLFLVGAFIYILVDQLNKNSTDKFTKRDN